ncbi:hypothetical protein [Moorena producens]|uniref:hypothetical protein n=1 Tax=Moorena producens TaxID=1155739 RepID=UPI0011EA6FEB|nr:hypothetical protein [Moorena producens]
MAQASCLLLLLVLFVVEQASCPLLPLQFYPIPDSRFPTPDSQFLIRAFLILNSLGAKQNGKKETLA